MFNIYSGFFLRFFSVLIMAILPGFSWALPEGFIPLNQISSDIIQDIKYSTSDNFIGRPIKGYSSKATCILTVPAAHALARVQEVLKSHKLKIKVFDCYRPTKAVEDFMAWSKDINDQKMKTLYYPNVNKADFFALGYVAEKSGHSRGSTLDLTLIDERGEELPMGTYFDFMDPLSHRNSKDVSLEAQANRAFLEKVMIDGGFKPYDEEWWHYTLKDEPYPDTYFNFPPEKP